MKKYYAIPIAFWIGLSIFVVVTSYKLGLGGFRKPGPGFLPFLLGFLLFFVSSYALIRYMIKRKIGVEAVKKVQEGKSFGKLSLVLMSLFAYALFLETLGYLIATCLILILLFRSMGSRKWTFVLASSVIISLVTYFGFSFFGIKFPMGILQGILR